MHMDRSVGSAKARVRAAASDHGGTIEKLARLGYAANGVVYLLIGWLAVKAAAGAGGETTDSAGALRHVLRQSYGDVLLAAVAIGLFGYALWRFVQCFMDPDREGSGFNGLVMRAGYFISGLTRVALAAAAVAMLAGRGGSPEGSAQRHTAALMSAPAGRVLVAIVGVGLVVAGISQFFRARSGDFLRHLGLSRLRESARAWVRHAGQLGHSALGVVFSVMGVFLLMAAYRADPRQARGPGEALQAIGQQPYGRYSLAIVGAGLLAYGLFQFLVARYRRIPTR
jgi:hypothetical protein